MISAAIRSLKTLTALVNRDITSSDYEGHECVLSLTPEEWSKLLSCWREPSLPVPTKVLYNLLQEEQLRKCFDWYWISTLTLTNDIHASHQSQATNHSRLVKDQMLWNTENMEVLSVEKHLPTTKKKFSPSVIKSDNACWLLQASHHPLRLVQLRYWQ